MGGILKSKFGVKVWHRWVGGGTAKILGVKEMGFSKTEIEPKCG